MDTLTPPSSRAGIAFCEMLLERIQQLETHVEELKRERKLEARSNGVHARVRNGKAVLFDVNNVPEEPSRFPPIWSMYCEFPNSKVDMHLDEVEAVLTPEWKGVLDALRRASDVYDVSVEDIPEEHRGVLDTKGHDQVQIQVEAAYLKARFPLKMVMIDDDLSFVVLLAEESCKRRCLEDLFSLYFELEDALWAQPEEEKTVGIYPVYFPKMKFDLWCALRRAPHRQWWSAECSALVSLWPRRDVLKFLDKNAEEFREDVVDNICNIHRIRKVVERKAPKYIYYK